MSRTVRHQDAKNWNRKDAKNAKGLAGSFAPLASLRFKIPCVLRLLRILFPAILITLAFLGLPLERPLYAQSVPAPETILGFKPGADFHLASYEQALAYLKALEKASPMIRLVEIGRSSMGKPMVCTIITSAANMKKLERLREISQKLALAEGLTDEDARRLAAEGRAVVYIDGGLHASEVAPAQHNLQLAYDLLTADDAETRLIRENTILLLNFPNPDGLDIVVDWYSKNVGTPYEVSPSSNEEEDFCHGETRRSPKGRNQRPFLSVNRSKNGCCIIVQVDHRA